MTDPSIHRRTFLARTGLSLGGAALSSLLARDATAAIAAPAAERFQGVIWPRHHPPKAKSVIFLCLAGGPSHLETFDPKPKLAELDGQPMPESVTAGQPIAQLQGKKLICLGPRTKFSRYGQCGAEVSDFFPKLGTLADSYAIVRSMVTDQINHDPAHTFMNCGTQLSGRPSMGAWVTYGLGSEADDLPGFVVMTSKVGRNPQPIAARQWHSGFLPGHFQGVEFSTSGSPVHYVENPPGVSAVQQRDLIDTVAALERHRLASLPDTADRFVEGALRPCGRAEAAASVSPSRMPERRSRGLSSLWEDRLLPCIHETASRLPAPRGQARISRRIR